MPPMKFNKIYLYPLLGLVAFLASCATEPTVDPTVTKTEEGYVNPYEPGSYEHFKAEKNYPKTYNVWKNVQKLPETNSSNSWVKVSLSKQRAFLMNGEEVVMDYPVCSGIASRPTPPGDYKIIEKIIDKRSNLYGKIYDAEGNLVNSDADTRTDTVPEGGKYVGAPMKYWMRLTNDGVGHHIGNVRRYPASHACIRGPSATMPIVYSKVKVGSRILVE
ncbi:L,D-transpeptidase family protein [Luteolibacter sp. AS25]|uniref:L,D-transpeptidase family protein n=1 Tax=Luteolibacter sp. AS25 TaxID=3135776 RepID=UPI00398B8D04